MDRKKRDFPPTTITETKLEEVKWEIEELRELFCKARKENLKLPPRGDASSLHNCLLNLIKESTRLRFEIEDEYGFKGE